MADIKLLHKGETDWHLPLNESLEALNAQKIERIGSSTESNIIVADGSGGVMDGGYSAHFLSLPTHLYAGRELPYTWAEIKAKVAAYDFTGIRVGDYKTITLSTGEVVICEVAGMDTYYQYGDTAAGHHLDWISRDCLAAKYAYNTTATNSGGFVGSALKTTLNGTIYNTLPADLKAIIIEKRGFVETKTEATASGASWQSLGKLWIPTEQEVWGQVVRSENPHGTYLAMQYAIFKDSLRHIAKGAGNGGERADWWLLSSVAGSASSFCRVSVYGYPGYYGATNAYRVPLCFRIG